MAAVSVKGFEPVRLGMMQPYFFPYPGYFGLIHATDQWVVFDTAQYIRRGWVNRNRILSTGGQRWKYVRVPVRSCPPTTPIRNILIDDRQNWRQQLLNDLDAYRLAQAPRYAEVRSFLMDVLDVQTESLCELLIHTLNACCDRMGLTFNHRTFSDCNIACPEAMQPGDWALHTAAQLNAETYINPPGGRNLFDETAFCQRGVQLKILEPELPAYPQGGDVFQPGLSIIDAFMWNDPTAVLQMIGEYQLLAA